MRLGFGIRAMGITLALFEAGCQSGAPSGRTASDRAPVLEARAAQAGGLSIGEVADASRLYAAKCGRCHGFYHPSDYDDTEWRLWMSKMSKKARLKQDQATLLSRYLEAFRGGKS